MIRSRLLASIFWGLLIPTACEQNNRDSQTVKKPSEVDRTILAGELSTGDWIQNSNGSDRVLMYGVQQSEPSLTFRCDVAVNQIIVEKSQYIPDKNEIQVKFLTPTGSKNYQATVENHGLPAIHFSLDLADPFLEKLADTEERFAIVPEVGKQLLLPASAKIKDLIQQCS